MRLILLIALAVTTASGSAALAQGKPTAEQIIKAWDKDGDGAVSSDEWIAAGRKAQGFDFCDADKDGKVTAGELAAAMAKQAQMQGG